MTMCFVLLQYGRTPLHIAAFVGHVKALRHLLDRGAIIDPKNEVTYLVYILKYNVPSLKLLIKDGTYRVACLI